MNKEQLVALLIKYGIDPNLFGKGEAKTLDHLLEEIDQGESVLVEEEGRLVRQLSILGVNVFAHHQGLNLRLIEDRQVFVDGRERRRKLDVSLAEKLQPGEDVGSALIRALHEELGVTFFNLVTPDSRLKEGKKTFPSFPGLSSVYRRFDLDILIDPSEYRQEGYQEIQPDKTTYFVWREVSSDV